MAFKLESFVENSCGSRKDVVKKCCSFCVSGGADPHRNSWWKKQKKKLTLIFLALTLQLSLKGRTWRFSLGPNQVFCFGLCCWFLLVCPLYCGKRPWVPWKTLYKCKLLSLLLLWNSSWSKSSWSKWEWINIWRETKRTGHMFEGAEAWRAPHQISTTWCS